MGSIADLLGDQLRAGLAQLVDPDADGEAPDTAQASSVGSSSASPTAAELAREAAMEAVLDEADLLAERGAQRPLDVRAQSWRC